MKARDVAEVLERIAPLDSGITGDQLGFVWGEPDSEVNGVGCLWCVHTASLRECAEGGLDMIVCHEAIWLPGQTSKWYQGPGSSDIFSNRERRELIQKHAVVIYRSHSNWDALPKDGIADAAVAALGIEGLKTVARQKFFSVQELPKAVTVRDFQGLVEGGLGFLGCRLFGDAAKRIRRFAFLIGGFGENQIHMPQAAMEMGAEALVIGEMSEYILVAALEMGLPVIETLHSMSEIPGIRRQAAILGERLPELRVEYVPSGAMSFGGG